MKRKILLILTMCFMCLCFVGCKNENDFIDVHNKSGFVFDNVSVPIKEGYYYEKHEKFLVDEDTVAVTIYFSREEDAGWDSMEEGGLND